MLAKGLLPLVGGLKQAVDGFNDLIAQPISKKLEEERIQANVLAMQLMDTNLAEKDRFSILEKLKSIAPDIVKGINAESLSLIDLRSNLAAYNDEMVNKIILQQKYEEVEKAASKAAKAADQLGEKRIRLQENIIAITEQVTAVNKQQGEAINKIAQDESKSWQQRGQAILDYIKANDLAGPALEKWLPVITDMRASMRALGASIYETNDAYSRLEDATGKVIDVTKEHNLLWRQLNNVADSVTDEQAKMIESYRILVDSTRLFNVALSESELKLLKEKKAEAGRIETIADADEGTKKTTKSLSQLREEYAKETDVLKKLIAEQAVWNAILDESGKLTGDQIIQAETRLTQIGKEIDLLKQLYALKPPSIKQTGVSYSVQLPDMSKLSTFSSKDIVDQFDAIARAAEQAFSDTIDSVDRLMAALRTEGFNKYTVAANILEQQIGSLSDSLIEMRIEGLDESDPAFQQISDNLEALRKKLKEVNFQAKWTSEGLKEAWQDMSGGDRLQYGLDIAQGIADAFSQSSQTQITQLQAELSAFEQVQNAKKETLEKAMESGLITQEDYQKRMAKIDQAIADKQKEIAIQRANIEKKAAKFSIIVNTAAAIVKVLAQMGLLGIPFAAVIAGMGIAQLKAVEAEPISFAKGGMVKDKTLAYIGDNPNASMDPEVVAPLSKLTKIISDELKSQLSSMKIANITIEPNIDDIEISKLSLAKFSSVISEQLETKLSEIKIDASPVIIPAQIGEVEIKDSDLSKFSRIISEQLETNLSAIRIDTSSIALPTQKAIIESIDIPAIETVSKMEIEVTGKLTGDDIYLANKRAEVRQGRIK